MQEIKVSVIIPMYNSEKYIERCIKSIQNQTLKEIEIIIVDDESTDTSPNLCKTLASEDGRIHLVTQKNSGPGLARNRGMAEAKGEYVAFVDSDDTIASNMYEVMYKAAKQAQADACLCGFSQVEADGTEEQHFNPLGGECFEGDRVIKGVLLNILGSQPDATSDFVLGIAVWKGLYSRKIIQDKHLAFYSERVYYSEDTMFNVDYFLHSQKVVMVKDCLYKYQKNDSSFTATYKTDMHDKNIRFYQAIEERIQGLDCYAEAKMRLQRLFLGFVRYYLQRIVELYPAKEAMKQIKDICRDSVIVEVMKEYPFEKNPWKQRMIHQMIAFKNSFFIWCFIKMKNS